LRQTPIEPPRKRATSRGDAVGPGRIWSVYIVTFLSSETDRQMQKQKRRLKALSDPSFGNALPPAALHLDYMSSEYSSPGEDSDEEDTAGKAKRAEKWGEMMTVQAAHALNRASNSEEKGKGKGGWADGVQEKVLEVRTPRWRSNEVSWCQE
jgi:hypothetical protein